MDQRGSAADKSCTDLPTTRLSAWAALAARLEASSVIPVQRESMAA